MSEKKVGKRLLTWVLVLVMTLSLLPLNVLAASGPETDSSSGMIFTKQLVSETPDNAGNYTIRMTAQATGKTTTTTEAVPMDIVLVLDQSGSMKDKFDNDTRQSAMKEAVISFIDEVADKNADHRMAIVTFSDDAKTLARWTAVNSDGADALTSKISGLPKNPSGATNVGEGMETARTLMNNSEAGAGRLKTVIVFTDGVPTTASDFSTTVANTAIDAAKGMKAAGVTVYTVGIFNGADPDEMYGASGFDTNSDGTVNSEWAEDNWGLFPSTDFPKADRPAGNRFLNLVSSNYPNADSIGLKRETSGLGILHSGISYTITKNFNRVAKGNYYLTAVDASELNSIFKTISDTIVEPDNPELNGDTVITDTLSDYFTFAGTADDVKVYAIGANGDERVAANAAATPNGKTVTVTGYDFSAHYQGIGGDAEETLVIEIKVKPDTSYTNWGASGKYDTNKGNATVTLPNIEKPIAEAASPKAPIDTYKVTYKPGNGTGNEYTDQYYLNGAKTPVKANTFTAFTAPDGYDFDCWKDEDGRTYQAGDEITFDKSDVILTAQWKKSKYTVTYALTDDVKPSNYSVPTDNKEYTKDEQYTVDSTHKANDQVVEGGYTYTFSGWKLNGVGDVLTGPQTMDIGNVVLKGTWTKTVNKYTVTYEYTGTAPTGAPEVPAAAQHDYDVEVTIENAPTLTGYTFHGWTLPEGLTANGGKFNMPAEPVTITGYWTANTDTKYTVKHYQQNLDNDDYTLTDTESDKTGTTGELTDATAKNYEGFTAKPFDQQAIAANGRTVVDIYYDRNTYSVTYTDGVNNETIFEDEVHQNVKYGAPVPAYNNGTNPSRENYTFAGWNPSVPATMPAHNLTVAAKWEKNPVDDGTFDFNDVDHDDGKATPAITKTVKGNVGKNFKETFKVTVEPKSDNAKNTMTPDYYTGKAEVTYSDLKDIAFRFAENDKLTFHNAGSYIYTVREIPGKTSRMSYDTTEYTLTIEVVLNEDTNTYQVKSWQFTAGKREYPAALNIVNTYRTYHPSTPSKPTVEIPDDDALGLNTTDHFAYIVGYGNGEVRPQNNITRAEVATIFFRLLTDDVRDENLTKTNRYSDVAATSWYNTAVSTLSSMGIITGYPDGTFRPNAAITRAEFAAIAARFDHDGDKTAAKFSDIANHWAKDEISIAYNNGWINGYPNGTFGPQRDITRAETMTLVNRVLNRQPETEDDLLPNMTVWTDNANPKAWYYLAVQEATNSHYYEFKTNSKYEKWTELRETRDWTQLEK